MRGTYAKTFEPSPRTKRLVRAVSGVRRGKIKRSNRAVSTDERGETVIYRTRRTPSAEESRTIVSRYCDGEFIKDIARDLELDHRRVRKILYDAGVAKPPHRMTPDEVRDAARQYEDGASLAVLGDRYGVDAGTVRTKLRAAGVMMRPSSVPRHQRVPNAIRAGLA